MGAVMGAVIAVIGAAMIVVLLVIKTLVPKLPPPHHQSKWFRQSCCSPGEFPLIIAVHTGVVSRQTVAVGVVKTSILIITYLFVNAILKTGKICLQLLINAKKC